MFLLLISLISLSDMSILNYISLPNRYFNCLPDVLSKEECLYVNGEWEEIEPINCENKGFTSNKEKIGICCNMKCLSRNGIIKVELENSKICNYNNNTESFYGFKDYSSFNDDFLNNIGYTDINNEYMTFKNLTNNKEISSVLCSFPTKQNFLKGLSLNMNDSFNYILGGGTKDGPTRKDNKCGFDCARLVMFLLDKIIDFDFDFKYTNAEGLYNIAINNNFTKSSDDLKAGDVLFFQNKTNEEIYHTIIYLGDNEVISAGRTGKNVTVKKYYIPENTTILAADFINFARKEEESLVHGYTDIDTEMVNTTIIVNNEIKGVNNFEIIKYNLALLIALILFL